MKTPFLGVFLGGEWNLALAKSGTFPMVKQSIISKYALDLKSDISTYKSTPHEMLYVSGWGELFFGYFILLFLFIHLCVLSSSLLV